MSDDGRNGTIALHGFDLSPVRDRFMYPTDTYTDWVLLAPVSGSFAYELKPQAVQTAIAGGTSGECGSGDLVLCPPGVRLDRQLLEPSRFLFVRFGVLDDPLEPWWPSGKVSVSDRQRLRTNFRLLDDSAEMLPTWRDHIFAHVLVDVLIMILWENAPSTGPADEAAVRGAAYLEKMVSDPNASVAGVAAALRLSPTQFTRRFRAAYGVPPIRYLNELRLATAQRLLLDTDDSVTCIASRCGYRSPFYFSRVFHKFMGESPVGYRKSRRA